MSRSATFWRRRSGVTLIEVLAAMALLGSLAVAMVLSRGRLIDQHQLAQQKMDAVNVADALLAQWWTGDPAAFPIEETGEIDTHPDWAWQTREIPNSSLRPFAARVVQLRIVDESAPGEPIELTSVDLVMPNEGQR